jgi:hypothetical protein
MRRFILVVFLLVPSLAAAQGIRYYPSQGGGSGTLNEVTAGEGMAVNCAGDSCTVSLELNTSTSAPGAGACDASSEEGNVWVQTGDPATVNGQVFICRKTGASSYAWHPIAYNVGTTAPATCTTGAVFFDSDATAGSNWLGCTSANTWTVLGLGGGGAPTDAEYVVAASDGTLSAERVCTDTTTIDCDAGTAGQMKFNWLGATFTAPLLGPTGCGDSASAYGFTADAGAGLCLVSANNLRIKVASSGATGFFDATATQGSAGFNDSGDLFTGFVFGDDLATFYASSIAKFQLDASPGTGLLALRGGSTAAVGRTITAGTGTSVANGDGQSGNPTASVDTAVIPQYSSGTSSVAATGAVGTFYFETDRPAAYTYPATDAETVLLSLPAGTGISGGIPYFTATADVIASSAALTANLPVIGGGAGAAPTVGTRSGNTTQYVTTTGAQTSGDCVKIDANGNHVANGSACGSGSLDINGLTAEEGIEFDDVLPFYDSSASANRKVSRSSLSDIGRDFWVMESEFISQQYPTLYRFDSTGTGAAATELGPVAGRVGVIRMGTGTTTTGRTAASTSAAEYGTGTNEIAFGSGRVVYETSIRLPNLSDATDTFTITAGYFNCLFSASCSPTDAVWITYTHGVNSGKWRGICIEDSSTTNVDDAGTAVAANTWYRLGITVNADATSAEFFVNGTSIGSCSTNIPDSADPVNPIARILKSAGTTSRTMDIDYVKVYGELTTPR